MNASQAHHEPWGKLDRANPDPASALRLSLVAHSIDVAAVARALLELPTWRTRLECLAGRRLTSRDRERLTVLAFLHDVGKAGAGFYSKGLHPQEQQRWRDRLGADRGQLGHVRVVAPLLGFESRFEPHRQALGVEVIRRWGGDDPYAGQQMLNLWMAAVSHHGEPLAVESLAEVSGDFPTWLHPIGGYDPVNGLRLLGDTARRLWPCAFDEDQPTGEPSQGLIHAFAGLVSLADWIGSNTDPDFFPFGLGGQDSRRWDVALPRARDVLRRMRIDVESARDDLRRRSPRFGDVFPFPVNDVQQAASEPGWPNLVVLEAETGGGKTEAALWRFKTLFESGEVDALCFLLPTRVAATGIFERLQSCIVKLFPDEASRPNTVLAVPGYLRANGQEGRALAPFTVLWPDAEDRSSRYWAAENSKRYFAGAAVAGTIDQFLLSTLQTKHAHLRGTALLRSLVVVDEVHASDRYMRVLLSMALKRHLAAGGHALLLSATLTSDARAELLDTARQRGATRRRHVDEPTSSGSSANDYPRITAPGRVRVFPSVPSNKSIRHSTVGAMRDAAAVADLAAQAVEGGARVLVLRNTVRQAIATQRALEMRLGPSHPALFRCNAVVALHHGRYALPDRQALDAAAERCFGKKAAADRNPLVLCATQTLEISVDCDADVLITDLAPMDVLLQRLGRLHRHRDRDPYRAAAYGTPQCVVITPPDRNLGALLNGRAARGLGIGPMSAYPDLLCLKATWQALDDHEAFPLLRIPEDNRALVERCCSGPALDALARILGGPWLDHLAELTGKRGAQGGQALNSCIDWLKPWCEASPGELRVEARTRLGLDGIDLELPGQGFESPFGHRIERLTMPAWMLPSGTAEDGAPLDMQNVRAGDQALHFELRGRAFVYDRFGLASA